MITRIIKYKNQLNTLAELGWQEHKTTKFIHRSLLPIAPVVKGFGEEGTGLLYRIGKGSQGMLLRADIDALRTEEGIKHICGHSSHTAGLMAALIDAKKIEDKLTKKDKSIYFLFQPSEETFPSGAKTFIQEQGSVLKTCKYAFGLHVKPLLPLGDIGLLPGPIWARGDYMEIEIHGKMVHVKDAPYGTDALLIGAKLVIFIKQLQKQYAKDIRISIGTMHAGLQANTVADFARLTGDIRMKDERYQKIIKETLTKKISELEEKYKAKIKFTYFEGVPVVKNDTKLTQKVANILGKNKKWSIITDPSLFSYGCEDFAYISQEIPSVYAFIGTGDKHDIHEKACTISDKGTIKIYEYFLEIIAWWQDQSV